jgi:hypothetical protein
VVDDDCAILRQLVDTLARMEVRLEQIAQQLDRLVPAEVVDPLAAALAATFGRDAFTSSEAMTRAEAQRLEAEAAGLRLPDLPAALDAASIRSARALGRRLAALDGRGIERGGEERGGVVWLAAGLSGAKPTRPVSAAARAA